MNIPQGQIREWKQQFGKIYSVSIRDVDYVFREVTFDEYDDVVAVESGADSAQAEDYLVSLALIHPKDIEFDSFPAGVVTRLAEEIMEVSGFGSPRAAKEVLDEYREEVGHVRGLMKAFVLATMPAYKEEDLDSLTFSGLAWKVALAEQIIKVNQAAFGVENEIRLDLIDPEEEAALEQEAVQKHAAQKKPGQASLSDPIAQRLQSALGG